MSYLSKTWALYLWAIVRESAMSTKYSTEDKNYGRLVKSVLKEKDIKTTPHFSIKI